MHKFLLWQRITIISIVIVDQLTKYLVRRNFQLFESKPIFSFLSLTYIQNTGIAFGMFQNEQYSNIFFIFVSIGIIFGMYIWYEKILYYGRNLAQTGVSLIYAGAIGNLIDRIIFGKVIDFIDLHFWPVFNIADSSITIGGIILFLSFCRFSRESPLHPPFSNVD